MADPIPASELFQRSGWQVAILFDGDCPLCAREIAMLERRNPEGRLATVDIAAADFDAGLFETDHATLMARIHGVLPDRTLIEGMEVFRRAYTAVGLGWVTAPSAWPVLGPVFDAAYRWFAKYRLRLTGRNHACEDHCAAKLGAGPA
ncbi:MAG: DUF393 domain-containing protein [Myxococcota bacterium]